MLTVKSLRESIKKRNIDEFKLQEYVKFLAYNIGKMSISAEIAYRQNISKAAILIGTDLQDVQDVYDSFRSEVN